MAVKVLISYINETHIKIVHMFSFDRQVSTFYFFNDENIYVQLKYDNLLLARQS